MYMSVRELNEEQLLQLKWTLFNDWDNADEYSIFYDNGDSLTQQEIEILDNACSGDEIPNEIVYKLYDGITFVEEDFWSVYDEE